MADTQRTLTAFTSTSTGLFKDNTVGGISAQDLRDFVESMKLSHGSLWMSDSTVVTSIAASTTWTKVAGTTTASTHSYRFTSTASNYLKYTGTASVHGIVRAAVSSKAVATNKTMEYGIFQDGVLVAGSELRRYHGNADFGAISLQADVEMGSSSYFEVYVRNMTDATDVVVSHLNLFCQGSFD